MKLNEIVQPSGFLTDKNDIREWIRKYSAWTISDSLIFVHSDHSVSIDAPFGLRKEYPHKQLGVKLGEVKSFDAEDCANLESIAGFPQMCVTGGINIAGTGITSLCNFPVERIDGFFTFEPSQIKEGGIGLMNIQYGWCGLAYVGNTIGNRGYKAFKIIEKYMEMGSKDYHKYDTYLFDCQAELIDQGYEEFAKL